MIIEVLRRSLIGIAIGALVTFVALTILVIFSIESTVIEIWRHFLSSMLMGVYFSLASLIFESERGSVATNHHPFCTILNSHIYCIYICWLGSFYSLVANNRIRHISIDVFYDVDWHIYLLQKT